MAHRKTIRSVNIIYILASIYIYIYCQNRKLLALDLFLNATRVISNDIQCILWEYLICKPAKPEFSCLSDYLISCFPSLREIQEITWKTFQVGSPMVGESLSSWFHHIWIEWVLHQVFRHWYPRFYSAVFSKLRYNADRNGCRKTEKTNTFVMTSSQRRPPPHSQQHW